MKSCPFDDIFSRKTTLWYPKTQQKQQTQHFTKIAVFEPQDPKHEFEDSARMNARYLRHFIRKEFRGVRRGGQHYSADRPKFRPGHGGDPQVKNPKNVIFFDFPKICPR